MLAIGLMSGTSLDGVDAALVEITGNDYILKKFITLPYDEEFRRKLMRNVSDELAKLSQICSLNFELGYKFVEAIDLLLADTGYSYKDISFVASHGQTVWHIPRSTDSFVASTLQIGEPSIIAYETGIETISNFRVMDMAAGGEGAPLVPYSEYLIFKSDNKNIILQNIGGISNLTYLPMNCSIKEVIAFDNGVGNIMIDYFTKKYFNKPYDDGGQIAQSGEIISSIINHLMDDDFIYLRPPKTTGREKFSTRYMEDLSRQLSFDRYDRKDIITTITEYTVRSIVYNYRAFIKKFDLVVVSGGGSHNKYIIKRLKDLLNCEVKTQEELGYNSDAKEAVAFVVLAHMSTLNKSSNVPAATGAKENVILGNFTKNPHVKG